MSAEKSFEEAMKRLEEIVSILENGKCSLDDSMKLSEEGTALSMYCRKQLDEAELKIKELSTVGKETEIDIQEFIEKNEE